MNQMSPETKQLSLTFRSYRGNTNQCLLLMFDRNCVLKLSVQVFDFKELNASNT